MKPTTRIQRPEGTRRPAKATRSDRSRGAVIVEAAIVMPLLFALLAGFIDFAWVFNDLQTTRQEAREITRQAVVGVTSSNYSCSHGAGSINNTTAGLVCEVKERVGSDAVVKLALPDVSGYEIGNALMVCVQLPYESITGMYDTLIDDGAAKVKVESRIEAEAGEDLEAFSEPALAGQTWGFCA